MSSSWCDWPFGSVACSNGSDCWHGSSLLPFADSEARLGSLGEALENKARFSVYRLFMGRFGGFAGLKAYAVWNLQRRRAQLPISGARLVG